MLTKSPIVSSLISLVIVSALSALILGLCKPKMVQKSKSSQKLACDKLIAWSLLFGVIVAIGVLLITMSLQQKKSGMYRPMSYRSPSALPMGARTSLRSM